jgi:N-acetylmuramoyl-L-alanine amidase
VAATRLTRRSLILAAGGALGARLASPGGALAALAGPPPPALDRQSIGTIAPGVHTLSLEHNADLLGLGWRGQAGASVRLRFRDADGRWSAWVSGAAGAHGPDRPPPAGGRVVGEPVWTGGTRLVQLRNDRPLLDAFLQLVDVSAGAGAAVSARAAERSPLARIAAASLPLATPVLRAGSGQPAIISRAAWARGSAPPKVAPEYGAVRLAFVHHTENPNGYRAAEVPAMLRAIYTFHRYVHGWNDIGYNFVIDAFGRIFEARAGGVDEPVVGAQAGGYNLASTGIAVLGSFMATPISPRARTALQRLLAWKLALHGVPARGRVAVRVNPAGAIYSRFPANALVPLPRIAGHRDADSTDCPGNVLYGQLGGIRGAVHRLAPNPTRATLALVTTPAQAPPPAVPALPNAPAAPPEATPPPAPTPAAPTTAPAPTHALSGTLALLDATPVAAATVQIQQRTVARRGELVAETTIAQVVTDAAGGWSLPVVLAPASARQQVALRALYAGAVAGAGGPRAAGASVSEPIAVAAAAVTPQPVSASA